MSSHLEDLAVMNAQTSAGLTGLCIALLCGAALAASDDASSAPTAHPGTEAALRRSIAEVTAGTPDYTQMSPGLGDAVRQQLPQVQALFKSWGPIQTVTFKGIDAMGGDLYEVVFEKGSANFLIALGPDGRIVGEGIRPAGGAGGGPPPPPPEGAPKALPGPYSITAEPAFGNDHLKIFRPTDLEQFPKHDTLPVVAWGNGGCAIDVPLYAGFLTTIASHGFLVITTTGAPAAGAKPALATADDLKAAIDWADQENRRTGSPLKGKIDTKRVAIMGQSCGGFLAINLGADPRVRTIGVFNSGMTPAIPESPGLDALKKLHGPILLINGGKFDSMMAPSKATYDAIGKLPAFYGSRHDVGHAATMFYPGGGEFANVAWNWLQWQFKHDRQAAAMFVGAKCALCTDANWDVEAKRLPP
jgi:dienelactone hydrolase